MQLNHAQRRGTGSLPAPCPPRIPSLFFRHRARWAFSGRSGPCSPPARRVSRPFSSCIVQIRRWTGVSVSLELSTAVGAAAVTSRLCLGPFSGRTPRLPCPSGVLHYAVQEDDILRAAVMRFPFAKSANCVEWRVVAEMAGRTTKQCRERWINVLDPSIRRSEWSFEEVRILFESQEELGNKWSTIATRLPGRCVPRPLRAPVPARTTVA